MSSLKVFMRKSKVALSFWLGAALILAGIGLSVYTDSMIGMLYEKYKHYWDLTDQERWDLDGSLDWWNLNKITTFYPLSIMLMAAGFVAITYSFIMAIQYRPPSTSSSHVEAGSYQEQVGV